MKKPIKLELILLLFCALVCVSLFACSTKGAAAAFALNRAAFVQTAQDALVIGSGAEVKRPIGVEEICVGPNPIGNEDYVEFQMGSAGFGPSTSYWGVMFSEGGPLGFQGVAQDYVPDGDGWFWEEPDGDNWSRITQLEENWYLYEMHF